MHLGLERLGRRKRYDTGTGTGTGAASEAALPLAWRRALGAGLVRRRTEVTLPLLRAPLLDMLYVVVDGMTTLSSVIFLVSGDHKLASVAIFNHASSGYFGQAAAKSVVILAWAGLAIAAIWWLEQRGRRRLTVIR